MRNPLDHVSSDFWQVTRDFDKLHLEVLPSYAHILPTPGPGQRNSPITGQLVEVREIDIARIKEVANTCWYDDDSDGSLKKSAENAAQQIEDVKDYVAKGWDGDDFVAFSKRLDSLRDQIQKIVDPAKDMAEALKDLATALEESLTETIGVISGFGTLISALLSIAAAAAVIPEPTVSKIVALVAAIIAGVFAAVTAVVNIVKGIESRQKAVNAVIQECTDVVDVLK